ncbi:hypothetical protein DTO013E5_3936 [Penicillium roqueforti]|nr:hypothetical protein CBS147332_3604 [Penicillium roqueforti]KAI2748107.1 hypothetical protein DTO012A1_753 [Penicillium roqueforti]KAI2755042.1 hypothetical protein DTO013F2_1534 [Penicillium roqueforti]KAI3117392.1 hypothetical protein CBS147331_3867 [Penicillium roqueforti]KAI3213295.1 hypothetical protein DTO013E5_3936 [Penicillium roqueforti]
MSNLSDRPWTEEDKYTLLTEILKKAGFPSSYLVRMIKEYGITPNWEHIPLPQGRSLSSCKTAYLNMVQQPVHPPTQPVASFPPPSDMTGPPAPMDPSTMRKRPLHPSDKPIPRAIQPRPPASTASYSSESGASAQLSPRLDVAPGEPPRKRGRPSKAETERRKLLAEARGETYPAPRRSGWSRRLKVPSSPTSPAAGPSSTPFPPAPQAFHGPKPSPAPTLYDTPTMHSAVLPPGPGPAPNDERRDMPPRMNINMRELPRPTEMVHPLPSPHALQLGPPDAFPRFSNPAERPYSFAADRFSPSDSSRRDSLTRPDQPAPYSERTNTTQAEKPPR